MATHSSSLVGTIELEIPVESQTDFLTSSCLMGRNALVMENRPIDYFLSCRTEYKDVQKATVA